MNLSSMLLQTIELRKLVFIKLLLHSETSYYIKNGSLIRFYKL